MEKQPNIFVAKTFAGLENVLAEELAAIGAKNVQILRRAVSFSGDQRLLYKANVQCRTAISILVHLKEFSFQSKDGFYEQLFGIDWQHYFHQNNIIAVRSTAYDSPVFNNTMFLAQLSKDAIVDHFREKTGSRPNVDVKEAGVRISINVHKDRCQVSLDSSGEALFKRGYRKSGGPAPINEVLAAGLIKLSGWDLQSTFLDPMCGSGTFSIEAALMNARISPGSGRKAFGFSYWKDYDPKLFQEVIEEARSMEVPVSATIIASDIQGYVLDIARQNVMQAGLLGSLKVQRNDFFSYHPPSGGGWLLLNPPYGQRMEHHDIRSLHKDIGSILKHRFTGFSTGIISSEVEAMKYVGLKPIHKYPVFNGPLPCTFHVYEMFEGKRKEFVANKPRRPRIRKDSPASDVPPENSAEHN